MINTESQQENDVRQELDCRVVVFARGMAIYANVTAAIQGESDVGVSHGQLTNKFELVGAWIRSH